MSSSTRSHRPPAGTGSRDRRLEARRPRGVRTRVGHRDRRNALVRTSSRDRPRGPNGVVAVDVGPTPLSCRYHCTPDTCWLCRGTGFLAGADRRGRFPTSDVAAAEELLAAERHVSNDLTRAAIVGAAAQVALVRGVLGATARTARDELVNLRPPNSTRMHVFTNAAYESVARVAFFSGERDVLEWAAAALSEGANSKTRVAWQPSLPLISACWRMPRPHGRWSTRPFVTASSAR